MYSLSIAAELQRHFVHDNDFILRQIHLGNEVIAVMGLKTLIDFPQTISMIRDLIQVDDLADHDMRDVVVGLGDDCSSHVFEKLVTEIQLGMLLVVHENSETCVSLIPVPQTLSRSISAPLTENSISGSNSAFNESMETNVGLLRKYTNADDLQLKTYMFGSTVKNRVTVSYLKGAIDPAFLQTLIEAIESRLHLEVNNLQDFTKVLGLSSFNLITHYHTTEMPQSAMRALRNGRAVLFIERVPFALVLPSLFADLYMSEDDNNLTPIYTVLLRLLRLFGILTTLIAPGLYVALVSVNPDVLRFELAHSIAKSRLDVPYPAIVETLLLLIVLELLMEAIIRLPSSIGPTVTMVGGIVLGQAAVSAKLVSNLLIIVLAVITISSATVVGIQNSQSLRVFKYLLLFLAAAFGVLGLMSGLVVLCSYHAGFKTFNLPYLQSTKPKGD
ncbi:spore germination protein [Paenibacillus glycinis]|uniref:Spore gernimation protein GerA n=1 Tax=Paenibacillus glycinis TaxID=2697035 RepID=A0ABW9XNU9_9BACL|nr:spore germination protein [Paenibacillus glycinis]NBD24074.1 spore gernimation protein GerA [Paenibacillus glycinis]